jgi:hypothetical protein
LGHRKCALAVLAGAGAPFVIFPRALWKLSEMIAVYRTAFARSRFSGKAGKLSASGWRPTWLVAAALVAISTLTSCGGSAAMGSANSINHVILMLQENRSFDTYFGMLNPYRKAKGWNVGDDGNVYNVDGIDDKLTTLSNEDDEGTFSRCSIR